MATPSILFLVLSQSRVAKLRGWIDDAIVPGERESVHILSDACAASFTADVRDKVAQKLIGEFSAFSPSVGHRLFIDREVKCSIENLTDWWKANSFGRVESHKLSMKAIERVVNEHLQATGRHWKTHATAQIERFEGPRSSLDGWLQQFARLGCIDVGRKIASQLNVIKTGAFPNTAFKILAADLLGARRAHCYIEDHDIGGSWGEMRALLTHAYPTGSVFPVHWNEAAGSIEFPDEDVDEIVIHEDGLWSGHETVRRLKSIAASPPPAAIILKFGVVSDFGLMVTRQAIRKLGLNGKVTVDASASEVVTFLAQDIRESLRLGLGMDAAEYYQSLHEFVDSLAFRVPGYWLPEEIELCEAMGAQLVRHWLRDKDKQEPSDEKVKKYSLGGGGFASTILFSRSVPKVCLPLLWLDGPVSIGDRDLFWKPLFVDARRVTKDKSLFQG